MTSRVLCILIVRFFLQMPRTTFVPDPMSLHYTVSDNAYVRLGLGTRLGAGAIAEAGFEHANAGQLKMVEGPWILLEDQIW